MNAFPQNIFLFFEESPVISGSMFHPVNISSALTYLGNVAQIAAMVPVMAMATWPQTRS